MEPNKLAMRSFLVFLQFLFSGSLAEGSADPSSQLIEANEFARADLVVSQSHLVIHRPMTLDCVLLPAKQSQQKSAAESAKLTLTATQQAEWYRNYVAIGDWEAENGLPPDSYEILNNSLRLLPSKTPKELIGLYHCALRLAFGVVSSPPVNLAVAEIRKFRSKDEESPAMKVPPFNPAFFFCKPPDSYPLAQLEFEINRVNINDMTTEQKANFLVSSRGLHILNFTSANEGEYRCLARNPVSNVTRKSRDLYNFSIETDTSALRQPPSIIFPFVKDTFIEAKVGSDVTFDCVTYGGGPDAASWEKFGGVLPRNRFFRFGANLVLKNLTASDSGSYVCRCRNAAASSRRKFVRNVGSPGVRGTNFVVYKLAVREPGQVHLRKEVAADQVTLSCEGRGVADVQLRFDGQKLPSQTLQKRLGVTKTQFDVGSSNVVQSVTMSFARPMVAGVYECVGWGTDRDQSDSDSWRIQDLLKEENLITTQSFRGYPDETTFEGSGQFTEGPSRFSTTTEAGLTAGFLPVIVEGPESANVYEGDVTHLVCLVESTDNVYWQKDGQTLTKDSSTNWSLIGTGTLQVSQVKQSDSGRYTCVAENSHGSVTASARLRVSNPLALAPQVVPDDSGDDDDVPRRFPTDNRDGLDSPSAAASAAAHDDFESEKIRIGPPELVQMSNKSVMLMWSVPAEAEGKIQFFKIQYKMAKAKSGWVTLREQLPPHVRNHMVGNLVADRKYTFRVAVMFTNNHQSTGERSEKFLIETISMASRPPSVAPKLIETESIAPSAIRIVWEYSRELDAPADGFLVQFRPYYSASGNSGGSFFNVTIKGSETREHILDRLLPATPYEIAMTAFNAAGKSPKSNTVQRSTLAFQTDDHSANSTTRKATVLDDFGPQLTTGGSHSAPDKTGSVRESTGGLFRLDTETLLVIIGAVLGAMLILLVLFMAVCFVRLRRQKDVMLASNGKFNDISKKIHREHSSGFATSKSPQGMKESLGVSIQPVVMPGPQHSRTANGHTVNLYQNPLDSDDVADNDNCGETDRLRVTATDEDLLASSPSERDESREKLMSTASQLESPCRRHFDLLNSSFGGGTLPPSPLHFLRADRISNSPSFRGSQRSDSPVAPLVVVPPESSRDFWSRSLSPRRATTSQVDPTGESRPQFATFRPPSQPRGSPLHHRTEILPNSTPTEFSSPHRLSIGQNFYGMTTSGHTEFDSA